MFRFFADKLSATATGFFLGASIKIGFELVELAKIAYDAKRG